MELEFHQLDLRYEGLRVRHPARERRLLASLADAGQQTPIVVVATAATHVVVDGHTRVRCLRRLHRDTVTAVAWDLVVCEKAAKGRSVRLLCGRRWCSVAFGTQPDPGPADHSRTS